MDRWCYDTLPSAADTWPPCDSVGAVLYHVSFTEVVLFIRIMMIVGWAAAETIACSAGKGAVLSNILVQSPLRQSQNTSHYLH
jgi:hypothetical protein